MADMSTTARNNALTGVLPTATTFKLALYTTNPGTTGTSYEVTGGSYARKTIKFAAASGGSAVSNTAQTFTTMPAALVKYVGIWKTSTYLWGGALTSNVTVPVGATLKFAAGGVTASIS
jgi:hypothetical protein